ncbi:MAG: 2'-5' RNA ligase family protein [Romboutsia sp.]
MRYIIVSVVKNNAGNFNNNLRKDIFEKFGAKSSKLPAHFTIKSPFESGNIKELEDVLYEFSKINTSKYYKIKDYDNFDDRVIFMKILMSNEGQTLHDKLIDALSTVSYINFNNDDGKNKIFHVTISSKKIQKIFTNLLEYISHIPCEFDCSFDNICIYKWQDNTWKLHKEYLLN